jgi:hypothetical protein
MTLDTFFKKFDQFAATPNAVAKMPHLSSANGVTYDSLGQRSRTHAPTKPQALKGRHNS